MTTYTNLTEDMYRLTLDDPYGWRACWTLKRGGHVERPVTNAGKLNQLVDRETGKFLISVKGDVREDIIPGSIRIWHENDHDTVVLDNGATVSGDTVEETPTYLTICTVDDRLMDIPWTSIRTRTRHQ